MTTYAEALTVQTADQIAAASLAAMAVAGVDQTGWGDLQVHRALVSIEAKAGALEQSLRKQVLQAADPSTVASLGADWTAAFARTFREVPIPALPAVWRMRVTNASGGAYDLKAGQIVAQSDAGILYDLSEPGHVAANGGTASLDFTARTPGIASNALAGEITHLAVSRPGLSVSNALGLGALVSGGRDIETPVALVARCLAKWGQLGAGATLAAYNYRIPTFVPTITRWQVRHDNPGGPGTVWVYLANGAGPATGGEIAAELAALMGAKPLGTGPVSCFAASSHPLAFSGTLVTDGTNANATAQGEAALAVLSSLWPLGATFILDRAVQVLMSIAGVVNLSGLSMVADEALSGGEVLELAPSLVQV